MFNVCDCVTLGQFQAKLVYHASALKHVIGQVFSWDTTTNAPDKDEHDGRSYISAVSEVITDDSQTSRGRAKNNMGEARMDIEDSEMVTLDTMAARAMA